MSGSARLALRAEEFFLVWLKVKAFVWLVNRIKRHKLTVSY